MSTRCDRLQEEHERLKNKRAEELGRIEQVHRSAMEELRTQLTAAKEQEVGVMRAAEQRAHADFERRMEELRQQHQHQQAQQLQQQQLQQQQMQGAGVAEGEGVGGHRAMTISLQVCRGLPRNTPRGCTTCKKSTSTGYTSWTSSTGRNRMIL